MKKVRSFGKFMLDLEFLLDEAVDVHEMQMGDILYIIYGHLKIHRPDCIETYVEDETSPEFYYGHKK